MKQPIITNLNLPALLKAAASLPLSGTLTLSHNKLSYLDISDDYIHHLFPLLQDDTISKPNYFGSASAGAHITVIYPEEGKALQHTILTQEHSFTIKNIVSAKLGTKTYHMLLINAPSLLEIRRTCHLPDLLCFKGYAIGFHITIGVKQ